MGASHVWVISRSRVKYLSGSVQQEDIIQSHVGLYAKLLYTRNRSTAVLRIKKQNNSSLFFATQRTEKTRASAKQDKMASVKRFVPLLDRILVQAFKAEAKTASGLYLPDAAKQSINQAKVI
jgi:hypothetical protein